jgi:hypothetical protein
MDIGVPEVKMFPWVGANYSGTGYRGRKLLILGESEYEWEKDALKSEVATELIRANVGGSLKNPFYTKIYNALSDEAKGQSFERFADFWHSIAFYNYIQEKVGTAPRERPTKEMWPRWKSTFLLVLEKLNPDRVLVLGRELWSNLNELGLIRNGAATNEAFFSVGEAKSIKVARIPHPASFGFKPSDWRKATFELLS